MEQNIHTRKKEFHSYYCDDIALEAIGMNSYTYLSISGYLNRGKTDDEIKQYFNNFDSNNLIKLFTGDIKSTFKESPAIFRFNKTTKQYDLATKENIFYTSAGVKAVDNILELINRHNDIQFGIQKDDDDNIIEVVKNIQTSLSGCITFRPTIKILDCDKEPQIKLYFKDRFSNDKESSKTIAQRGSPIVVEVPTNPAGLAYGAGGSNMLPNGTYQNPSEGGVDNPTNTIAAPIDLRYNASLGKYQGGTHQIFARLITDIDPAPVQNIDVNNLTDPNGNFYDSNSTNYISDFTIGQAVPLSVENGNPYQFGPNIIGCPDQNIKVQKLLVVNRSPRSFKKGDLVILSHIDNEWIIQGFDVPTITSAKTGFGKWQFQKFIANYANFFRGSIRGNNQIKTNPDFIESELRTRYYLDMIQGKDAGNAAQYPLQDGDVPHLDSTMNNLISIARLNLYLSSNPLTDDILNDFNKSKQWIENAEKASLPDYLEFCPHQCAQISIFDQLSTYAGGTNNYGTVIGRTVPDSRTEARSSIGSLQKDLPVFFGPVFPNGYNSQQISNLREKMENGTFNNVYSWFFSTPSGLPYIVRQASGDEYLAINSANDFKDKYSFFSSRSSINIFDKQNKLIDQNISMFVDIDEDPNCKQLPAEIALNGSLASKYGYPIEYVFAVGPQSNLLRTLSRFIGSNTAILRYNYLIKTISQTNDLGKTDILYEDLALSPIQPNIIQFSPLQLEFSCSSLEINNDSDTFWNQIKAQILSLKQLYSSPVEQTSLFGNFISRNQSIPVGWTRKREYVANTPGSFTGSTFFTFDNLLDDIDGKFLTPINTQNPLGTPFSGSDRSSNIFGIVASKNKFNAVDSIKFKVSQYFGLTPRATVTGDNLDVTTIGGFLSWSVGGFSTRNNIFAQWGDRSLTDSYDSTGTTALHVRIFDQWPDAQTIYLGYCFSVLHFNPVTFNSNRSEAVIPENIQFRSNGVKQVYKDKGEPNARWVDDIETGVDFRIPTYKNGKILENQETVPSDAYDDDTTLAPSQEWNINPIRRNALLTRGGFAYYKRVIGIGGIPLAANHGTGYKQNDILTSENNVKLKVLSIVEEYPSTGKVGAFQIIDPGYGFLQSDYVKVGVDRNGRDIYKVRLNFAGGSGNGLVLDYELVVYERLQYDSGPQQRCPITRLTSPSKDGKQPVDGVAETSISLNGNGKYDAFYFFHNDVLHTTAFETPYTPGKAQNITLEIT